MREVAPCLSPRNSPLAARVFTCLEHVHRPIGADRQVAGARNTRARELQGTGTPRHAASGRGTNRGCGNQREEFFDTYAAGEAFRTDHSPS